MHIRIRVNPGARYNKIVQLGGGKLSVYVKDKPERNLANNRAMNLLADHFGVPRAKLRIISGYDSPHKTVYIRH